MCNLQDYYRQPRFCRKQLPIQFETQRYQKRPEIDIILVAFGKTSLSIELH